MKDNETGDLSFNSALSKDGVSRPRDFRAGDLWEHLPI